MSEVEFLHLKGIRKTHQLNKRFNLTIGEMIDFLREYSDIRVKQQEENTERLLSKEKVIQFM